jgi:hypothetical protein
VQKKLEGCPSFFGLEIDQPAFAEELDHTITTCLADPATAEKIQVSADLAKKVFSLEGYVQEILEHLQVAAYSHVVSHWQFPPLPIA